MAWIESHQALESHPKLTRLMLKSGINRDTCIGKLHRLWWWSLHYTEDGNLSKYDPHEIMSAIGFETSEEREKFWQGCIFSNFIEEKPYLRLHDWWDYAGRFLQSKYKHSPEKWQTIKGLCLTSKNSSKNRSKTSSKHAVDEVTGGSLHPIPNQPNLTLPNLTLPEWIDAELWQAWKDKRKELKKPLTGKAEELAIEKLTKLRDAGNDPSEVLKESITNSWQGLFPLKQNSNGKPKYESVEEHNARVFKEAGVI